MKMILPRAALVAAIIVLMAVMFRATDNHFVLEEVLDKHAHNTYYFLADPLTIDRIYPPSIQTRMVDARVLGSGETAVEQYDLELTAPLPFLGNRTFAATMLADSRRNLIVEEVGALFGMIKVTLTWRVSEIGPQRLQSKLNLDVHTRLPAVCWLALDQTRLQSYQDIFTTAMERLRVKVQGHSN